MPGLTVITPRLPLANPGSAFWACCMLRRKRPAPISAISEKATCAMTKKLRSGKRACCAPCRALRSFNSEIKSGLSDFSAGASPNKIPVKSEIPSVNRSTLVSIFRSRSPSFMNGGRKDHSAVLPHAAIANPAAPPSKASNTLSVINCPISRPFDAPIDNRMAISFLRAADRTSNRFAMLAHAINSTRPTINMSTVLICVSPWRAFGFTMLCVKEITFALRPSLSLGYSLANCPASACNAACAGPSLTPGFNRPTTFNAKNRRLSNRSA